jgi:hypothetical protein
MTIFSAHALTQSYMLVCAAAVAHTDMYKTFSFPVQPHETNEKFANLAQYLMFAPDSISLVVNCDNVVPS